MPTVALGEYFIMLCNCDTTCKNAVGLIHHPGCLLFLMYSIIKKNNKGNNDSIAPQAVKLNPTSPTTIFNKDTFPIWMGSPNWEPITTISRRP